MFKIRKILTTIVLMTAVTNTAWANRIYTHVLTVCMDVNDPNYDPNINYDTINAAIVAMNAKTPPLDSNTLGCIKIYPEPNGAPRTYIEHLNDYYENCHNLPAHCDLIGMGDSPGDVVIQHGALTPLGFDLTQYGIVCNGDNVLVNLMVYNKHDPSIPSYQQLCIKFGSDSQMETCIVIGLHGAVDGGKNFVAINCSITAYWGHCIRTGGTFSILDCNLYPRAGSSNMEESSGLHAFDSGIIENVEITGGGSGSANMGDTWAGVRGIVLSLSVEEFVRIKNVDIDIDLTSIYNPNQTGSLHACGIYSGDYGTGSYVPYEGLCLVEDCTIDIYGIESTGDPNNPDDDGAGLKVEGIYIHQGGEVVVWDSDIHTRRTCANNVDDGYEYLLMNENGILRIDFDSVTFDPNGPNEPNCYDPNFVNGIITDHRVTNITQQKEYFYIRHAVNDANNGDVIEAVTSVYYEDVDFKGLAITLRSSDPNDWDIVAATIIDADGDSNGVVFSNNEGNGSVFTGFTVKGATNGVYCYDADPVISKCILRNNIAVGIYDDYGAPIVSNNKIYNNGNHNIYLRRNAAGAIVMNNFIHDANYGIFLVLPQAVATITNNTLVHNIMRGISKAGGNTPIITNCIIWDCNDDLYYCSATYSCIEDDDDGTGNIHLDPRFVDVNNQDYHLNPYSPCVDAGNPDITGQGETDIDDQTRRMDLDGQTRIDSIIDMGADEVIGKVHNLDQDIWFLHIQEAIDEANEGDSIKVYPYTFNERINFKGKAITLKSTDQNNWDIVQSTIIKRPLGKSTLAAVTFNSGEDVNSIITGFTIADFGNAIDCNNNSSPTIKRCIIERNYRGVYCLNGASPLIMNSIIRNNTVGIWSLSSNPPLIKNNFIMKNNTGIYINNAISAGFITNNTIVASIYNGIVVSSSLPPDISNCIIWGNNDDLYDCNATYSCIEDGDAGTGNINSDPCFVDADNNDFHINFDSPCIDAGDPNGNYDGQNDIDGESRVQGRYVDMGADEAPRVHNVTKDQWYVNIQDAVDDANNGNEIVVYPGKYYEYVDFNGVNITLRSSDPNSWEVVEQTQIISSVAAGFLLIDGEDDTTLIEGFTVICENGWPILISNGCEATIRKCIVRNSLYGIKIYSSSPATLANNKIYNNGYGISVAVSAAEIKSNIIYDNNGSGVMCLNSPSTQITNNTIVNNTTGIHVLIASPTVSNCIIWNNTDELYGCSATYSCIKNCDDANGAGNICGDANNPRFVDADNNDFHIDIHSPCVNAGDPGGSYTGESDIDGDARVVGSYVDMGADEVALLPDGHWWKLDETSGTTAYDFIDDDDGTFNGDDPCWVNGFMDGAADFNGVSDYFAVSSLDGGITNAFTVAGWLKTSKTTGMQTIIGAWFQNDNGFCYIYDGWEVLIENEHLVARQANYESVTHDINGTNEVADGNWHHFAFVFPAGTSTAILYLDGENEAEGQLSHEWFDGGLFRIGDGSSKIGNPPMKGGPFCGTIDDVMIFNRILSADEVEQLYQSGL